MCRCVGGYSAGFAFAFATNQCGDGNRRTAVTLLILHAKYGLQTLYEADFFLVGRSCHIDHAKSVCRYVRSTQMCEANNAANIREVCPQISMQWLTEHSKAYVNAQHYN